jgi:hypothetical protein
MNVTLKLPDELTKEARHLALDEGKSLSALVADLLAQRLAKTTSRGTKRMSLAEAMAVPGAPDWFYEKELPLPDRKADKERDFAFDPDER